MTGHANGHANGWGGALQPMRDPYQLAAHPVPQTCRCGRGQSDRPMVRRGSEFCSERCAKAATG